MSISATERAEIDRRAAVLRVELASKPIPDSVIQLLTRVVRSKYGHGAQSDRSAA